MSYRDQLIIKPGSKVKLADIDPDFHDKDLNKARSKPELQLILDDLSRMQEELYAEKKHALLIVLQGIDSAGKDGICWHVITGMNPQGCTVSSFKQPSSEELAHDFLWRVHVKTPGRGHVAVFNRSHYEDVLVVRVHDLVPKKVWSRRYEAINMFEELLANNGVHIIKFFLYISKEEQLERFAKRLEDKDRQWKISMSDYAEREHWDAYTEAYEDMLSKCSTDHAPWYVIPSNRKWFRNLAAASIIRDTLRDMHIKAPPPTVDIDTIRQRYHAAVAAQKG